MTARCPRADGLVDGGHAATTTKEPGMTARTSRRDTRRFRLAGNDNEIVVSMTRGPKFPQATGENDVEGHSLGRKESQPESMTRGPKFPQATGDEDAAGPDGSARR